MKKIKLIAISVLGLCLVEKMQAQDVTNFGATVFDLTNTSPGGSARMRGLGGAQTALGGDISSAYSNPAGLGFFNRSEFTFSPNFNYISTDGTYLGHKVSDSRLNFNFANLGVVINKTKSDIARSKWRGGNIGISINRVADFQNNITYEGENFNPLDNNGNLILDPNAPKDFIESAVLNTGFGQSGSIVFDNDFASLAYDIGLIDVFEDDGGEFIDRNIYATDGNGETIPAYPEPDFPTLQRETIETRGAAYQTSISYGGNYNDKVYFGAGIGIMTMNKEIERTYIEEPTETDLSRLTLYDNSEITGIGINATFGMIARPVPQLLAGLSYTTPTFHSLEQLQQITLSATFTDNEFYEQTYIYEELTYNVTTPSRLRGGLTYFFGKNGFITGDVERVNYGGGELRNASDGLGFSNSNQQIDSYDAVNNYRVGAEYRIDIFRVRGGFALLSDPIDDNLNQERQQVSVGAGIRTKDYYIDLGVTNDLKAVDNYIYPYPNSDVALSETQKTKVTVSVGFFF